MKTWRWMLTMVAAGSLVAACSVKTTDSDDDDGTSGTGGSGGSTTTTTATGVTSSTSVTTTGGNMGCFDDSVALVAPGETPDVGLGNCSAQQITDFFEACFNGNGDCEAFQNDTANDDCLGCMFAGTGTHFPPLLLGNQTATGSTVYVNVYACESIASGQTQCAQGTSRFSHCVNTSCESCMTEAEDQACLQEAQGPSSICSTAEQIMIPAGCESILQIDFANLSPECAGTDFQSLYTSAATYICGPAT